MQRTSLVCLLVAAIAVGRPSTGAGRGDGPSPQIPGAFRTAITLVPLDVRVLDRQGRAVTGLKQDDFTILEDGVRQEIAHFEAHALVPRAPLPGDASLPLRKAPSSDIAPQDHRIFLLVLGRGRLREPSKALDGLLHFVRERLLPQDQVAVFAWNRATDFTTDHEKVAQVLERFNTAHEGIEGRLAWHFSDLAAAYGSKQIPAAIQADIDAVFFGAGGARTLGYRHVLPGAISDSKRLNDDAQRTVGDLLSSGNNLMTDLPFEEFVAENARTMQDLGNVYAGIEYLRFLEGEKHLVLVTQKGLFLPRAEDDKRIAEAASGARVVIDTVQTGGLYVGQAPGIGANPGQWSQFWAFASLRTIAELSGGRSSVAEYTRNAVDRIDDSTRAGYLLGYYPKSMKRDGRYRKIAVKVNRPGLTLLYRHGYEAADQLVPFDRQAFLTFNRIISAALYPEDVRDIHLKVRAAPAQGDEGARYGGPVRVDITIDASRLSFQVDNGLHVERLDVAVFGTDSRGRVVDERWEKIELALNDDDYARARQSGIRHSVMMPGKPGGRDVKMDVKVIVYDYAADVLGSAVARVF
jgi:VWFA-related protein